MAPGESDQAQDAAAAPAAAADSAASTPQPKAPPPESPAETTRRSYIILSFWVIVLFLGLPIWWRTTTIYRANLPIDDMLQWADGKACRPVLPLHISVEAESIQDQEAQHLVHLTQQTLDDLNDFSGHHLRLQLDSPKTDSRATQTDSPELALTVHLKPGEAMASSLDPHSTALDITYPPGSVPPLKASSSSLATYVANELRATFAEEQSIVAYLLSTSPAASGERPQALTPAAVEGLSKRTTRSLRYAPTYHLAFSLFTDGPTPNTWDVEGAVDKYIRPMLEVLRPIHNFTVDTQLQLYATPGVQSQVLNRDDLASFINAAEWPLSPSIGGAPTVNFVIYVGNQTIAPQETGGDGGDDARAASPSWMIPQWGSVYLLPLPGSTSHVSSEALRQPMLTFGGHLLTLLGTPRSGSLPLRLSTLARVRSADLLLRASSTLGSLARLSQALPSISIPQTVSDGVAASMHHLERACASLGSPEGLLHARVAEEEAERAFFEKSMVGQLYFPDEHKVAVYLPLLGPVGVPLLSGLVKELRRRVKQRRERAQAAREKKGQ